MDLQFFCFRVYCRIIYKMGPEIVIVPCFWCSNKSCRIIHHQLYYSPYIKKPAHCPLLSQVSTSTSYIMYEHDRTLPGATSGTNDCPQALHFAIHVAEKTTKSKTNARMDGARLERTSSNHQSKHWDIAGNQPDTTSRLPGPQMRKICW